MSSAPLKLFVSYSHKDEYYRERLGVHLAALESAGLYEIWHDRKLLAGQDWAKEIDARLATADVVLLLVSADLIDSRYVWGIELEQALRQEAAGRSRIVSVILSPCRWHRPFSPLASRQALPPRLDRVKSVSEHPDGEEKAFDEVMEGLERLYEDLRHARRPAASANSGKLRFADRLRLSVGRHRLPALAAFGACCVAAAAFFAHGQLLGEAEFGKRLLHVGDFAGAGERFARASWWPGIDGNGAEFAHLGGLLARLGDEAVRREYVAGLEKLEKEAPDSGFTTYLRAIAVFEEGIRLSDPKRWLVGTSDLLQQALKRDADLAEAHAILAFLLSIDCQLEAALTAIDAAQSRGGDLAPRRYLVQKADILARFGDPAHREEALNLYRAQDSEAAAHLALALLAWEDSDWKRGRAEVVRSRAQLDSEGERPGWLLPLPDGPWLLGDPGSKRCLLAYGASVANSLAEGGKIAAAWTAVDANCGGIEPDARELVCTHLPESAAQARRELNCPSPQPRTSCRADSR